MLLLNIFNSSLEDALERSGHSSRQMMAEDCGRTKRPSSAGRAIVLLKLGVLGAMITELRRGRENEKQPLPPRTATSKLRDRGTPT